MTVREEILATLKENNGSMKKKSLLNEICGEWVSGTDVMEALRMLRKEKKIEVDQKTGRVYMTEDWSIKEG